MIYAGLFLALIRLLHNGLAEADRLNRKVFNRITRLSGHRQLAPASPCMQYKVCADANLLLTSELDNSIIMHSIFCIRYAVRRT
jgi:hypothetical protein